ncbi:hypothetical protein Barb6_02815 [Bacteroidales bacterium Barb6]|nr:hypothetical protein Barb6_02815 [Bacteroidales bacterium Barb6]
MKWLVKKDYQELKRMNGGKIVELWDGVEAKVLKTTFGGMYFVRVDIGVEKEVWISREWFTKK